MVLCAALVGCDSKPDAPFGFKWGQTVKETVAQNLKGAKVDGDDGDILAFISADSAPQPVQYDGRYYLSFIPSLGLTSATFSTPVDKGGPFFNEGRTVYNAIAKKLDEKYGVAKSINEKNDSGGAGFYECLKNESCGVWERTYNSDGMKVKLNVEPSPGQLMSGLSKGYVRVKYEYLTPEMIKKVQDKMAKEEKANNF